MSFKSALMDCRHHSAWLSFKLQFARKQRMCFVNYPSCYAAPDEPRRPHSRMSNLNMGLNDLPFLGLRCSPARRPQNSDRFTSVGVHLNTRRDSRQPATTERESSDLDTGIGKDLLTNRPIFINISTPSTGALLDTIDIEIICTYPHILECTRNFLPPKACGLEDLNTIEPQRRLKSELTNRTTSAQTSPLLGYLFSLLPSAFRASDRKS
ncbi:hypothetical protein PGT21_022679 [Puccinia graminis f. sp. tritici]|uniref:Uncharacterized protein n=1 Tax=Puccinia graminis f. sp. tritici TaxID=56615 RepID=A0A5B0QG18_PUCGR|nr:hypothetical protein PGTUg99_005143 [Puccinia graminis f. sp. tritici]KAA1112095.1 hypothetical protein PGT21_022679 [Puccinia graminis f. sp. tritici]